MSKRYSKQMSVDGLQIEMSASTRTLHLCCEDKTIRATDYDPRSLTLVRATRLFFFTGSWTVCDPSAVASSTSSLSLFGVTLSGVCWGNVNEPLREDSWSLSTLAAGVRGGSLPATLLPLAFLFPIEGLGTPKEGRPTFPKTGVAVGV